MGMAIPLLPQKGEILRAKSLFSLASGSSFTSAYAAQSRLRLGYRPITNLLSVYETTAARYPITWSLTAKCYRDRLSLGTVRAICSSAKADIHTWQDLPVDGFFSGRTQGLGIKSCGNLSTQRDNPPGIPRTSAPDLR
jgi:hypothetical protein